MNLYIICKYLDKELASQYIPYLSFRPNRIVIVKVPIHKNDFEPESDVSETISKIQDNTIETIKKLFVGLKPVKIVLTKEDILYNNKYLKLLNSVEGEDEA